MTAMHSYATDSNERKIVPLILFVVSVVFAWILHQGLSYWAITVPWWFDAPAVGGFYKLIYRQFDDRLWRTWLVRRVQLVRLPNLNGSWVGHVEPAAGDRAARRDIRVEIAQTWSKIQIAFAGQDSTSKSLMAAVAVENPQGPILSYEFLNEPRANAVDTMHPHRGLATLTLTSSSQSETLEGDYYTGRGRETFGRIRLTRAS